MKTSQRKSLFILLVILIFTMINFLYKSIFTYTNIYYVIFWGLIAIITGIILGYEKDRSLYKVDIIQVIIIYNITYLIISYLGGLIFGFSKIPYNLEIIHIIKNLFPVVLIIYFQEKFRYIYITKNEKKYLNLFLLILIMSLIDISIGIKSYDINNGMDIFEAIGLLILPTFITNTTLVYLTSKCGYKPAIIYRLIFEGYVYVVPIIPDFGIYIQSVLNIAYPTILYLKLNTMFAKRKFTVEKSNKIKKFVIYAPIIAIVVATVVLVSGVFKYYTISIGSNSMYKAISKGDAVIIEKMKSDYDQLEVGDILAHRHDQKIIVHRIIEIYKENNSIIFKTKGDNNDDEDNWVVYESDIVGKVIFRIPYIGYPSVWLSERIK